jgi:hypothetical protein
MLQRVLALEPGVQHPMREDVIGSLGILQSLPHGQTLKLPDAVHNDRIEAGRIRL